MGRSGQAITLVTATDLSKLQEIERGLGRNLPRVDAEGNSVRDGRSTATNGTATNGTGSKAAASNGATAPSTTEAPKKTFKPVRPKSGGRRWGRRRVRA
jgi:hypothetical protein